MTRLSQFAVVWLLVLGAVYGLIRATQAYLATGWMLCSGLPYCETLSEYYSARLANLGHSNGWIIRGPALAVLLGGMAAGLLAWARGTPKTIHLMPLLFGASGRTDRKHFWLALVFWIGTGLLIRATIQIVDMLFLLRQYHPDLTFEIWIRDPHWIRELEKWAVFLWTIGGLISMAMVSVRRVRDRGRNAWRLIPMYLLFPWAIVELGFLPGGEGVNSYGPAKIKEDPT